MKDLVWRAPSRPFAPEISDRQLANWRSRLGLGEESEFELQRIDATAEESRELARRIEASLPEERPRVRDFDWRWRGATPIVELERNGQKEYANLFAGTAFGDPGTEARNLRAIPEADTTPEVREKKEPLGSDLKSEKSAFCRAVNHTCKEP